MTPLGSNDLSNLAIRERVAGPCRLLITCQVANIIIILLLVGGLYVQEEEPPADSIEIAVVCLVFGAFLIKVLLSEATAYACWRLMQLRSYRIGRLLVILSLVPWCCIFINPFEIGFAIWLLVVLNNTEVKLAFDLPPSDC